MESRARQRNQPDTDQLVELTEAGSSGKFLQVAPKTPERVFGGARLMFENSTVCQ